MKKTSPEPVPRRLVMPLAAAALLTACERPVPVERCTANLAHRELRPTERVRSTTRKARDQASVGTRVKAALLARAGADAGAIRVASRSGGVVVLTGTVQSPGARVKARRIASSVASVTSVTDQLKVKS